MKDLLRLRDEAAKFVRQLDAMRNTAQEFLDFFEHAQSFGTDDYLNTFLKSVAIHHPLRGPVPYQSYTIPPHRKMIDHMEANNRSFILGARQMGVTTALAIYATYLATTKSNYVIAIAGPNVKHSQEMIERCRVAVSCGSIPAPFSDLTKANKRSLTFANGSKIYAVGANGEALKGTSISCLIIDQAQWISYKSFDEFWACICPTLHTGSKLIISTGARAPEGQVYKIWCDAVEGLNGIAPMKVAWWEHPDRDEDWKNTMLEILGPVDFARDMECEFVKRS